MDPVDRSPSLLALKELILLKPWKTPPSPLLSHCQYGKYMKVKDGSRMYRHCQQYGKYMKVKDGSRMYRHCQYGKYMKVKDGSRMYRAPKTSLHNKENDDIINVEIPYEGLFEFFVVRKVRVWIYQVPEKILSLPKYDALS
ncbi:unnamed protein product [Malus baccata var. baccata]